MIPSLHQISPIQESIGMFLEVSTSYSTNLIKAMQRVLSTCSLKSESQHRQRTLYTDDHLMLSCPILLVEEGKE